MNHASLFSGIGGPEVAACMMGWSNVFHCEINPFGRAVLDYWFPNSKSYEDITKTDFTPWRGRVDVLTGGFPCQPFSYAGKRAGREDERYLWQEMFRAISEIRPTWVVGENVAGITTMVEGGVLADLGSHSSLFSEGDDIHGYELEQTFTIERICRDLESLGYAVQPMLVPAAAVNAPHRRDRVFIIAYDADSDRSNDEGIAGEYEGEGEGEGIQKRHEIRQSGEPDILRSESTRTDENSVCDGCEELGGFGVHGGRDSRTGDRPEREVQAPVADSTGEQGHGCEYDEPGTCTTEQGESGRGDCEEDTIRDFADTNDALLQRWYGKTEKGRSRQEFRVESFDSILFPERRWAEFPTVSPVHRGNDGLPFTLDDLAIPFTKWRVESLKAYGNAIVPQVMYRIFQAIEEASK